MGELIKAGVERVVLSTAAVEDPAFVEEACRRYGETIIVSIDARDGYVSTHGWLKQTEFTAIEFAKSMAAIGVKRFIYTDIVRDGTLTEPNFTAISELIDAVRQPIIAAGGISSVTHLKMLKKLGASAAIIGKALYTGAISLKQALAAVSEF